MVIGDIGEFSAPSRSRSPFGKWHHCQYLEEAWNRTSARASPTDIMEGIPPPTLGPNRGGRFLYGRGVDSAGTAAVHRAVLYEAIHTTVEIAGIARANGFSMSQTARNMSDG